MSKKHGNLQVIYRDVKEIKELPNNPRTITDKQFDILKESIINNPEFFHARPILLSNRTGELVAFAGNKRLLAAIKCKMKVVPTILFENLSEEKEREFAIRDNIQNGDWDKEILIAEWNDIPLIDLGLEIELTEDPFDELPAEKGMPTDYSVTVYFKTKDEQQEFFDKIESEGYTCKK